ncbi:MAG: AIR synthase-related protein, partial [Cyanobacteria bacterium P01_A01_bin.83]
DKGGVGIELDLDLIPARETGMTPYEYLLSESQERMLFVAQLGREQELIDIFHKWELHAVVAGSVIEEPVVRILYQGEIAAEVTATALADDTPIYHRELLAEAPPYAQQAAQWSADSLPGCDYQGIDVQGTYKTWNEILLQLLDTPTIASKQWVYRQYDHQVQNNTVLLPGGADAAIVRVRPLDAKPGDCTIGVAATTDCNPRYVYLNPYEGAKAAVAEAARNLSCVGAEPLAVTDNLNFGSPEKPVGYWQLANACRGVADACRNLATPVTGGNVSLYNETLDSEGNPQPIYPTPVIGMVGLVPDITKICGQSWTNEGDIIYLLGRSVTSDTSITTPSNLGASEYLAAVHGIVAGTPPTVDFSLETKVQAACRHGIRQGWIKSAHDLAEGGLAVALAEACIGNGFGATVQIPISTAERLDEVLFGEVASQILVSVSPNMVEATEAYLQQNLEDKWLKIGMVTRSELKILTNDNLSLINVKINELGVVWQQAIENRLVSQLD